MDGSLKEIVNVQAASSEPEELVFVKARLQDWDDPVRPCEPQMEPHGMQALWTAPKSTVGRQPSQLPVQK